MNKRTTLTYQQRLNRCDLLQVLEVGDVAVMLNLSESRVRHLTQDRLIPHYRNSRGQITFLKSEVEKYQLGTRVPTAAELEAQAATYNVIGKR